MLPEARQAESRESVLAGQTGHVQAQRPFSDGLPSGGQFFIAHEPAFLVEAQVIGDVQLRLKIRELFGGEENFNRFGSLQAFLLFMVQDEAGITLDRSALRCLHVYVPVANEFKHWYVPP